MKTKKYIFIAAAASMLGMTTSCDDEGFLTEKPKTIYTTDNSYETIDQVKACITNLYIHIRYWYQQDYFLKGLGTDVLDTPYFRSTGNGYCNFANWSSTNSSSNHWKVTIKKVCPGRVKHSVVKPMVKSCSSVATVT